MRQNPILVSESDADRLRALLGARDDSAHDQAHLHELEAELERAIVRLADEVPPDVITMPEERVVSSGRVADRYFKRVDPVLVRPYRVELPTIPCLGAERVQFIVRGKAPVVVTVESTKGGRMQREIGLTAP